MSNTLYKNDIQIINQQELANLVGIENLVYEKNHHQYFIPDSYLSSINIPATLTKAGIDFTDNNCMEWTINA